MKYKTIKKLGVFDSGVGGLSVLQDILPLSIPEIVYFADTANLPYGEKSREQIQNLTLQAVALLLTHNVDAIVIACHTASANAYATIRKHFPHLPLFDVVNPVVKQALQMTRNNRIGVIGTQATITSNIHKTKILSLRPNTTVFNQACPQLVPLIESGLTDEKELNNALKNYLTPLITNKIDTLIIGCTHYELIKKEISDFTGSSLQIISAPQLVHHELTPSSTMTETSSSVHYLVSGSTNKFRMNAYNLLNVEIEKENIEQVKPKNPQQEFLHDSLLRM